MNKTNHTSLNMARKYYKHISYAVEESTKYIAQRMSNEICSLKTRWNKFNSQCMGGIEPNTIYTITGISGSGKSSFVNTLETDLIDLNPNSDVIVLNFTYEMLSSRQIGRKLSSKLRKTTSELYSANFQLSEYDFNRVKSTAASFKHYSIYYVDEIGSVDDIKYIIEDFYNDNVKGTDKKFIIILDHILLVKHSGRNVLDTISDLQRLFIEKKKLPNTTIIQLAQMNRNIEIPERINNPSLHFPMRSDISSADSIFHASDYVICIHRPEILGIEQYGIQKLEVENRVFLHLIKNRDAGEVRTLVFQNDLKYNNLIEVNVESASPN